MKEIDFNIDLYKKIAQSDFSEIKRLLLYGFGEPFINPNLFLMLELSREYIGRESDILISTNGTLLAPELSDNLLKNKLVDELSFSIDSIDAYKLRRIRSGSKPDVTMKNLQYLLRARKVYAKDVKIGVEVVLMEDNFEELPKIVEVLAGEDIDSILFSHVVPYTQEISEKTAYITMSRTSLDLFLSSIGHNIDRLSYFNVYKILSEINHIPDPRVAEMERQKIWEKALENRYSINLPLLFKSEEKLKLANRVEEYFHISQKIAGKYGLELKFPTIFPEAKKRSCPYVEKKALFIRSDGKVTPCMEFSYSHPLYVNMHVKEIREVIFGNIRFEGLERIWNKENYKAFRDARKNLDEKIPWCGDCVFSVWCFFARTNERDCYANEPGCGECLYSIGLSLCNM